jgi:NTE family protein
MVRGMASMGGVVEAPIAVVLAGAGARGAYEAGFIATLLPRLEPRPRIFVGTSAGAINAALLASLAHLPAEDARDEMLARWQKIEPSMVLGSAFKSVLGAGLEYLRAFVGGDPPSSLLDTRPLLRSLAEARLLDWAAIRRNVESGTVQALAFAATETRSGRTKVFYDGGPAKIESDAARAIDYVPAKLSAEHVRASAAIPIAFPPVKLATPIGDRYFIDGGVRLNVPLKPALALGAKALVVISTDAREPSLSSDADDGLPSPSVFDQGLQVMRSMFADRMIEDLANLARRNEAASSPDSKDVLIPFVFGGPTETERVGEVARRSLQEILKRPQAMFTKLDLWLLNLATSVSVHSGPDLLSYLLFDPIFLRDALKAGIEDAERALADSRTPSDLWRSSR